MKGAGAAPTDVEVFPDGPVDFHTSVLDGGRVSIRSSDYENPEAKLRKMNEPRTLSMCKP